jgi:alkylhydroperoxidase/carboxymuconolactone decarboxylase family protein YurZ
MTRPTAGENLPTPEEVTARLNEVRRNRGYLLPNQGIMAAALPDFQQAAAGMYRALTLTDRHLTAWEREFIWLALLITSEEHVGTHHVHLFHETGGTDAEAEACWRLVALGRGAGAFAFLDEHWQPYFPTLNAADSYRRTALAVIEGLPVPEDLARLALVGVQTALSQEWALAADIEGAYEAGVPEGKIAEAMSLAVWPCGMNRLIEGGAVWLDLIRSGRVAASAGFRAWADQPDQGGLKVPPRAP